MTSNSNNTRAHRLKQRSKQRAARALNYTTSPSALVILTERSMLVETEVWRKMHCKHIHVQLVYFAEIYCCNQAISQRFPVKFFRDKRIPIGLHRPSRLGATDIRESGGSAAERRATRDKYLNFRRERSCMQTFNGTLSASLTFDLSVAMTWRAGYIYHINSHPLQLTYHLRYEISDPIVRGRALSQDAVRRRRRRRGPRGGGGGKERWAKKNGKRLKIWTIGNNAQVLIPGGSSILRLR